VGKIRKRKRSPPPPGAAKKGPGLAFDFPPEKGTREGSEGGKTPGNSRILCCLAKPLSKGVL